MAPPYVIIFDGMCNFCSYGVNFIIQRDSRAVFLFAPMQSEAAQKILRHHALLESDENTFYLIKGNTCYCRSDAALEVAAELDGFWSFFRFLKIIPRTIRDFFYTLLADNRYTLFGLKTSCELPKKNTRKRFLV